MGAFNEYGITFPAFLVDDQLSVQGSDVSIAGGQTITNTPNFRCPPGMVVVKESGDGLYYKADTADGASAGDINTAAVVTSLEAADTDWDGTDIGWAVYGPDGLIESGSVTLAGTDDTTAEVVTALNANARFAEHLVASGSNGNPVVITSRKKGRISVKITQTVITTGYGASGITANGGEADYRVIMQHADLKDVEGTAMASKMVGTLLSGHFKESELLHLSAEAKAVFIGRGSIFE